MQNNNNYYIYLLKFYLAYAVIKVIKIKLKRHIGREKMWFKKIVLIQFILFLGISQQEIIVHNITNLMKMNNCSNLFELKNNQWTTKCNNSELCKLEGETLMINGINEITVKISTTVFKGGDPLLVYHKLTGLYENHEGYADILSMDSDKTKVFEMKFQTKNYLSFSVEFHYLQFCGTINYISMYYYTCQKSRHHSIEYPKQSAPSSLEEKLKINGTCSANSTKLNDNLYAECYANGSLEEHGKCVCLHGYTLNRGRCEECRSGYYKNSIGDQKCRECGERSISNIERKECFCKDGTFREISQRNNSSSTCHEPKIKIEFTKITQNKALMTWKEEGLLNINVNSSFIINCFNCKESEGNFPINTKKSHSVLEDLIDKKYYFLSLKAIYKQEKEIVIEKDVYCGFETSQGTNKSTDVIIISVTIPVIIISFFIIFYLYVKQKRRTLIFLRRINSLKRLRRPPPPPERADSTASEINPYAYFDQPKIPELKSDEESFDNNRRKENRYSTLTNSQPKKVLKPLDTTNGAPISNQRHTEFFENQHTEQAETVCKNNEGELNDSDGYINMNANFLKDSKLFTQHIYDNPEPRSKPRSKTFNDGKIQQSFKSKSVYYPEDSFVLRLSVHDINKAKLNNKYKRIGSEINKAYDIQRTHHSADDISKLYDML